MQDFRNLKVWQKSHGLTLAVYRATQKFPRDEMFALTQQLRRAAVSVSSNIAEGCGRSSNADFARFLWMANGSVKEVDYQLLLANDLGYLDPPIYAELMAILDEVKRMLASLIKSVETT